MKRLSPILVVPTLLAMAHCATIPTRRVWNQHAYHVTNVREDGTIPKKLAKSWLGLNTFRVNAQVEGNSSCQPAQPK